MSIKSGGNKPLKSAVMDGAEVAAEGASSKWLKAVRDKVYSKLN